MGSREDNDLIDAAIAGAQAQLEDKASSVVEDTAAVESDTSLETDSEVATEPAEAPTPKISKANRDKTGKFTKSGKTKQVSSDQSAIAVDSEGQPGDADQALQSGATPEAATEEIPSNWPPKLRALAAKAPPELLREFKERDAQLEQWARRQAQEGRREAGGMAEIKKVFEPHRAKFQMNGVRDEVDAVSRLLGWNEIFESDPMAGIKDLMSKNGISPYDLIEHEQQNPYDPRFTELERSQEEIRRTLDELRTQREELNRSQGQAVLETFKQGKDSFGQSRAQSFELYRPQITEAFRAMQQEAPHLSEEQLLTHAHEFVMSEVRKLHGITSAPKPQVVSAAKARAASKSITGAPSQGAVQGKPKLSGKNDKEKLDAAVNLALDMHGI